MLTHVHFANKTTATKAVYFLERMYPGKYKNILVRDETMLGADNVAVEVETEKDDPWFIGFLTGVYFYIEAKGE